MSRRQVWLAPAVAGGLAGIANGFFGGGGGMVLVPLLTARCGLDQRRAFATSVAIILPLCALSSVIYLFRGGLDLAVALPYLAGGLAGGFLGGRLFQKLNMDWLRRAFALLILYGGFKSLFGL
ncbi:sulfite exporter TauE/SafE family protein [Intestinimonas butyriciproducens]|uniref:Probable membrane transporter protein n=1 Tax=Intestinimonas butyriciproducens TaxID=1297617 RepID=A0A2U1CCF9_9FIRM|nr:sulfite exporter TauE/SafE family protein [Intestinimonas butyriciproducens]SCJ72579.1 Sulfite exporter TauE/SafE [uncultured Clostridium sp.]MBU5229509.1 sulfite exporter TauE/SafE family protein [Intestinimonas butyriciproducens]MCI6364836.1 sulfite exporter TauE/SafE family protein [Intestinimonas butyriciproducens]MCR1906210.1 sulfite exporter TauE/SafE family protein [Intestinimonas butyriciproducens]MDB7829299.1 sulfite exporter TauE/SafE family protein [Intestinimonas butyriciproduce